MIILNIEEDDGPRYFLINQMRPRDSNEVRLWKRARSLLDQLDDRQFKNASVAYERVFNKLHKTGDEGDITILAELVYAHQTGRVNLNEDFSTIKSNSRLFFP